MKKSELTLSKTAAEVARLLTRNRARLVLAESCTGGLIASKLTEIPGISNVFCGSHVVYRNESKKRWLGVKEKTLSQKSAVSRETVEEMVKGALKKTPEATIAAAVTGNLGPTGEPIGRVYVSILERSTKLMRRTPITFEFQLEPSRKALTSRNKKEILSRKNGTYARLTRRNLAATLTLSLVRDSLKV